MSDCWPPPPALLSPTGQPFARSDSFPASLGCDATETRLARVGQSELHISNFPIFSGSTALGDGDPGSRLALCRRSHPQCTYLPAAGVRRAVADSSPLYDLGRPHSLARMERRAASGAARRPRKERVPTAHVREVPDLVERINTERQSDAQEGEWTPERLRTILTRHLHGEKIVILANREPYIHQKINAAGELSVLHPASGLVTALEPVMRACSGVWVGHGSGNADRDAAPCARPCVCAPRGRLLHHSTRMADTRGREGLLLPLCKRRTVAAGVTSRIHARASVLRTLSTTAASTRSSRTLCVVRSLR